MTADPLKWFVYGKDLDGLYVVDEFAGEQCQQDDLDRLKRRFHLDGMMFVTCAIVADHYPLRRNPYFYYVKRANETQRAGICVSTSQDTVAGAVLGKRDPSINITRWECYQGFHTLAANLPVTFQMYSLDDITRRVLCSKIVYGTNGPSEDGFFFGVDENGHLIEGDVQTMAGETPLENIERVYGITPQKPPEPLSVMVLFDVHLRTLQTLTVDPDYSEKNILAAYERYGCKIVIKVISDEKNGFACEGWKLGTGQVSAQNVQNAAHKVYEEHFLDVAYDLLHGYFRWTIYDKNGEMLFHVRADSARQAKKKIKIAYPKLTGYILENATIITTKKMWRVEIEKRPPIYIWADDLKELRRMVQDLTDGKIIDEVLLVTDRYEMSLEAERLHYPDT